MGALIILILPIFAAATDACGPHRYATAGTCAVRNEVQDQSGKSLQSVPSVLLSPESGNRPSANSHTVMGTLIRLISLIKLIFAAATDACGLHRYATAGTCAVQTEASVQIRKISAISPISVTIPRGHNPPEYYQQKSNTNTSCAQTIGSCTTSATKAAGTYRATVRQTLYTPSLSYTCSGRRMLSGIATPEVPVPRADVVL